MVAKYIRSGSVIKKREHFTFNGWRTTTRKKKKKNGALLHTTWSRIKANRPENKKKRGPFLFLLFLKEPLKSRETSKQRTTTIKIKNKNSQHTKNCIRNEEQKQQ